MPKKKITVMGIDAAAVNSGVCIIEVSPQKKAPHVKFETLFEAGLTHGPRTDHRQRIQASDVIKGLLLQHGVDFVVLEDYIMNMGPTNTSAYQHGEFGGLVKRALWDTRTPFMLCGPISMRSFLSVPSRLPDSGKQFIVDTAKADYGFESEESSIAKRSNATDAFAHCIIGALVYFHLNGFDIGTLDKPKHEVLFGDGKKMKGLTNTPETFFDCDWAPQALD